MDIYKQALSHSSLTKDDPEHLNNDRLEFYGDAVLKLVISKYLFDRFPEEDEGILTQYRARIISDDLLGEIGFSLGFDKQVKLGASLNASRAKGLAVPKSVVGDAVEAHIAALYIDQGYEAAEKFILETWEPFLEQAIAESISTNYKSELQAYYQGKYKESPSYRTIESSGPDHAKEFEMGVYFRGDLIASAKGANKKDASQAAAQAALVKLV